MSKDVYTIVTDSIIEALEAGTVPWSRPWRDVGGKPLSLATNKPYRGVNVFLLTLQSMSKGYTSPYWLTFKQAKERGGSVRKGEKGTQIVLWKPVKKEGETEGERKDYMLLRYYTVFNAEQCDGIETPELPALAEHNPIADAQTVVDRFIGVLNGPALAHGGNRAYYSPLLDRVQMPLMGAFETPEHYYGTTFHELAHSTGHTSRLDRAMTEPAPFGSPDYSREELVAEMTAAFLCGETGIEVNVSHHASYIASWLKALENDRKLVVHAAAAAQKAADCVLGTTFAKEEADKASPRSENPKGGTHDGHDLRPHAGASRLDHRRETRSSRRAGPHRERARARARALRTG
jgi:antirestriction protein ArdC